MAIPNKLKRYGYHVVIAIDQLFNALTGGAADVCCIVSSTAFSLTAITAKQLMKVN